MDNGIHYPISLTLILLAAAGQVHAEGPAAADTFVDVEWKAVPQPSNPPPAKILTAPDAPRPALGRAVDQLVEGHDRHAPAGRGVRDLDGAGVGRGARVVQAEVGHVPVGAPDGAVQQAHAIAVGVEVVLEQSEVRRPGLAAPHGAGAAPQHGVGEAADVAADVEHDVFPAEAAREAVLVLDDDLAVAPDYLHAVERFFDDYPQFAAMKGRILAADDPVTAAGSKAPYLDLPIADHGDEVVEVRGVLGANMAFRSSALRTVGPFDERLGPGAAGHEEETELCQRIRRGGLRIGYAPRAVVFHEVDPARAVRERFIRIARERGYCRTLHEHHSQGEVALKIAIAAIRLAVARAFHASPYRIAREERRLAIAQGMRDGLMKPPKRAFVQ